jgi:hypothetical protein
LKHVDDKGDHLLIDDDYNVVGVIDWQFARTVPACEAFGPSLLTANLNGLYSRNSSISENDGLLAGALRDRGNDDLARHMEGSDVVRRFQFGMASGLSRDENREVIAGILASLGVNPPLDIEAWVDEKRRELAETVPGREALKKIDQLIAL